jgi:hypothetical protein
MSMGNGKIPLLPVRQRVHVDMRLLGAHQLFRNQQTPGPPGLEVEVVDATVRLHHRPQTGSNDERCGHALKIQQLGQRDDRLGQTRSHRNLHKERPTRDSPRPQVDSLNDPVGTSAA